MSQSSLPPEILGLSVPQRVLLAEQIWDSIAEDEQAFQLTAEQTAELERRLNTHKAAPDRGKLWPDVKKGLLGD